MMPSIADVLRVPAVAAGEPEVLGGATGLGAPVRWLHTTDGTDLAGLLRGGELILTAGERWTGSLADAVAYLDNLVENGASGVLVSPLTERAGAKEVLRAAARTARLPVVLLRDRVAFVELTEAVHRMLLASGSAADSAPAPGAGASGAGAAGGGVDPLRLIEQLSVVNADPAEVLRRTAELLLAPVVHEDLQQRVVDAACAGVPEPRLLANWTRRSRLGAAGGDPASGERWLRAPYRERGEAAGALVVPAAPAHPLAAAILERAAQVLAHCHENVDRPSAVRHRALAAVSRELAARPRADDADALVRAEAGGFPRAASYLPIAVRGAALDAVFDAAASASVPLVAREHAGAVVGVIGAPGPRLAESRPVLDALAAALGSAAAGAAELRSAARPVLAVGPAEEELGAANTAGAAEALAIAEAAGPETRSGPFVTAADVRLRRLLRELGDDPRIQSFVAESLAELRAEGEDHLRVLRAYLETNGNIAEVARAVYLSRPSVYARLRRIEAVIGTELSSVDTRMGVHLALLAEECWDSSGHGRP